MLVVIIKFKLEKHDNSYFICVSCARLGANLATKLTAMLHAFDPLTHMLHAFAFLIHNKLQYE